MELNAAKWVSENKNIVQQLLIATGMGPAEKEREM